MLHPVHKYSVEDCGYKTPCWIWLGYVNKPGYGCCNTAQYKKGRSQYVHVQEWEHANGPVPKDLELDHLCQVKACGRPDHRETVTHQVNIVRGDIARNGYRQQNKTHCPKGHVYSSINSRGHQQCDTCRNTASKQYRARKTVKSNSGL